MPFKQEFDDIYKLAIKAAAKDAGVVAQRVDEQMYSEGMLDRIHRQIKVADFVIADMSGKNANVFYEIGYAIAKGKYCITLVDDKTNISFDLKHKRHIVYNSITELKAQLTDEIKWAVSNVESERGSKIQATLKAKVSTLHRSEYRAIADIDFAIDLKPTISGASPEIENAYFYSGQGWALFQNSDECSQQKADISEFMVQHFLSVPVKRVRNWVQIKFKAKKTIASKYKGDELKSVYTIGGRAMLRLCTSEGDLDYEFMIDETVDDEIPF